MFKCVQAISENSVKTIDSLSPGDARSWGESQFSSVRIVVRVSGGLIELAKFSNPRFVVDLADDDWFSESVSRP